MLCILVKDPFVDLGETVHFPCWGQFFDFSFPSYGCFCKKKKTWPTRQKVFPLPTVRALSASNSPSALSAQAGLLRANALAEMLSLFSPLHTLQPLCHIADCYGYDGWNRLTPKNHCLSLFYPTLSIQNFGVSVAIASEPNWTIYSKMFLGCFKMFSIFFQEFLILNVNGCTPAYILDAY